MSLHTVLDKSRYETDQKAQIQETGDLSTITKQNNQKTTINITSFKADASIPLP